MRVLRLLPTTLALLALAAWGARPVERAALFIQAPREPELALPVYAQFTVTQSLRLDEPVTAAALRVPLYIPEAGQPFTVRMLRDREIIEEWPLPDAAAGLTDVTFPFTGSPRLAGLVEVQFDGSQIPYAQRDTAPRVLVESADAAYPAGSYRIAQNHKSGDIGLTLIERPLAIRAWYDTWRGQPAALTAQVMFVTLGVLLAWLVPVPAQTAARTIADTTRQSA